jgi:hypothetical protein
MKGLWGHMGRVGRVLLYLLFLGCAEPAEAPETPAPFYGPAPRAPERLDVAPAPAPLVAPAPPPAPAPALADPAALRRDAWTTSRFRCRAISTTRLRTCRFERTETGWSITFPVADLTCGEVVFDAAGDPSELRSCSSKWLRVPATAALRRSRAGDVWSGSHAGWRWPSDGETYCCPGLWIEAPEALRGR